jgi:barstar (barnase inhibitor)
VASTIGAAMFSLSTRGAATRADFFDAVRASLPLNPPVVGSEVWDALSDSLWEGIYEVDAPTVLITWTGAADLQRASPEGYAIAMEVFRDLVSTLGNEKYTVGKPKQVCVYVA